jgi:hypothetical protein
MTRVGIYLSRFQFRGTAIAQYDYATGLIQQQLATPIFIHWPRPDERDERGDSRGVSIWEQRGTGAREMFERRFGKDSIKEYRSWKELYDILNECKIDILYILTSGIRAGDPDGHPVDNFDLDEMTSRLGWPSQMNNVRVAYHFVYVPGNVNLNQPRVATISKAVAQRIKMIPNHQISDPDQVPIVPHLLRECSADCSMSTSVANRLRMRQFLGIPPESTVFGRLGGVDTFNIEPVISAIIRVLQKRKDVYFVFATTPMEVVQRIELSSDPRVLLIAPIYDDTRKCALIDACDYMLHASQKGESFGLNVLEFLARGRPVITFEPKLSEVERLTELKSGTDTTQSELLKWLGYHNASLTQAYYADQHLQHLKIISAQPNLTHMYKTYWDDTSLDNLLNDLKPLEPHDVCTVRFHQYTEAEVMKAFARVFLEVVTENQI